MQVEDELLEAEGGSRNYRPARRVAREKERLSTSPLVSKEPRLCFVQ